MLTFTRGASVVTAASAIALLFGGVAHATPTPEILAKGTCGADDSSWSDSVPAFPIFKIIDTGTLGLPPLADEHLHLFPENDGAPREPIQVEQE